VNGGAPASYSTTNAAIVPVIQGYWTSFIRSLDPNKYRYAGTAEWEAWDSGNWRWLLFETNATRMEEVGLALKGRCQVLNAIGSSLLQ